MGTHTHRKHVVILSGLLGAGFIGYLLIKQRQGRKALKPSIPTKSQAQCSCLSKGVSKFKNKTSNATAIPLKQQQPKQRSDSFPLRLGSSGERVRQLQMYLMRFHGSAGIITDLFDEKTAERTKRFLKVEAVSEALYNVLEHRIKNHKNQKDHA